MEQEKEKLIRDAEKLRRKVIFPLNLFVSPDYESSAEKFEEVGDLCTDPLEKEKYYDEAVKTLLMEPSKTNKFQAYIIYEKIANSLYDFDNNKVCMYFTLAGDMVFGSDKNHLAAINYGKAIDIYMREGELKEALKLQKRVVDCYKSHGWKSHYAKALRDLALLQFKNGHYEDAANSYIKLEQNIYTLCAGICYYLLGTPSDLDVDGPEKEIYDALEYSSEEVEAKINNYLSRNAVGQDIKEIFSFVKSNMKPENDIL